MSLPVPVPVPEVPAKVRFVLYWTSYILSSLAAIVSAIWQVIAAASPDVAAPLWITLAPAIMLIIVAQLNALAGANVSNKESLMIAAPKADGVETRVEASATRVDERGAAGGSTIVYIILVLLAILLAIWVVRALLAGA